MSCRLQDTSCRLQATGCRIQAAGCRIQDTGYRIQDGGWGRKREMFEEFLNNQNSWLKGGGASSEIVFSSRIRLARNLSNYLFASRIDNHQKEEVLKKIKEIMPKVNRLKKSIFVSMQELSALDRQFLLERHLISQEHLSPSPGKGLIVSPDEKIAIMINEEDHLRMQVISSGFNLRGCWDILDELDNELSKLLALAFLPDLGYLTACPTNVGTGLRASCMLHLPALVLTKRINKILELLAKISFTTRGLFGEGTAAYGNFFQVSNQVSLGLSERELIDNLIGVVNQVLTQETDARRTLLKKYKVSIEDKVWRAVGILRSCRLINTQEALNHLSMLSLGRDLGIIKERELSDRKRRELINSLFIIIQPAHLQKMEKRALKEEERDYIRAVILREKLKS